MVDGPDGMEYDDETGEYVVPDVFDAPGAVHATIVTAVAAATDTEAAELERLHERVDADALGAIFEPRRDGNRRSEGELTFPLGDAVVTLRGDGELRIRVD